MSKFTRAAQTSQSLSLAAMEEASRMGRREADIDHLFLALVISDQAAGRVLRGLGIDLTTARLAVEKQHEAQLASLGIEASFPMPGRIVFHETDGYEWNRRATDLIARSGGKEREGDAAAVLRELVLEPSGLILDILQRLNTTPTEVLDSLDRADATPALVMPRRPQVKGWVSGSTETFVPASIDTVWEFLTDPYRVPEWEVSIGSISAPDEPVRSGEIWHGLASVARPDGKPLKINPKLRRRTIELVQAERPNRAAWRFTYPDAARQGPILTTFDLAPTDGGTQVTITTSWARSTSWKRVIGLPMRPLLKFFIWIGLFQTGSAISRAFR